MKCAACGATCLACASKSAEERKAAFHAREIIQIAVATMNDKEVIELETIIRQRFVAFMRHKRFVEVVDAIVRDYFEDQADELVGQVIARRLASTDEAIEDLVRERVAARWEAEVERVVRERLDAALAEVRGKLAGGGK